MQGLLCRRKVATLVKVKGIESRPELAAQFPTSGKTCDVSGRSMFCSTPGPEPADGDAERSQAPVIPRQGTTNELAPTSDLCRTPILDENCFLSKKRKSNRIDKDRYRLDFRTWSVELSKTPCLSTCIQYSGTVTKDEKHKDARDNWFLRPAHALQRCVVGGTSWPRRIARRFLKSRAVLSVPTPHVCHGGGWVGLKTVAASTRALVGNNLHRRTVRAPTPNKTLWTRWCMFEVVGTLWSMLWKRPLTLVENVRLKTPRNKQLSIVLARNSKEFSRWQHWQGGVRQLKNDALRGPAKALKPATGAMCQTLDTSSNCARLNFWQPTKRQTAVLSWTCLQ